VETIVNAVTAKPEETANVETTVNAQNRVLSLELLDLVARLEGPATVGMDAAVLDPPPPPCVSARLEEAASVELIASAVTAKLEEIASVETTASVLSQEPFLERDLAVRQEKLVDVVTNAIAL
jgi:hypothetical protein